MVERAIWPPCRALERSLLGRRAAPLALEGGVVVCDHTFCGASLGAFVAWYGTPAPRTPGERGHSIIGYNIGIPRSVKTPGGS